MDKNLVAKSSPKEHIGVVGKKMLPSFPKKMPDKKTLWGGGRSRKGGGIS